MQQLLEISTCRHGRHALVAVRGELDLAGAAEMRARLRRACEENEGRVILDLSELMFVDSTGLSILVEYHAKTRSAGGRLILVAPRPAVVRVLDITGLRERLYVCARLDEVDHIDRIDDIDDIDDAESAERAEREAAEETGTRAPERAAEAEV